MKNAYSSHRRERGGVLEKDTQVKVEDGTSPKRRTLAGGQQEELSRRLDKLIAYVVKNVPNHFNTRAQKALSDLIVAVSYIERSGNPYLAAAAEVAAEALYAEPQKLELARKLVKKMNRRLLLYRLLGSSPSMAVAFGLGLFFYLLAPFSLFIVNQVKGIDFQVLLGTSLGMLVLIALAGAMGSIVSVLIGTQNYSVNPKMWGPIPFVCTGLFKPIVGMAFALFIFATLHAGIIPVDVPGPDNGVKENYFFLAIAFVAGFSERFARDVARDAGGTFGARIE